MIVRREASLKNLLELANKSADDKKQTNNNNKRNLLHLQAQFPAVVQAWLLLLASLLRFGQSPMLGPTL